MTPPEGVTPVNRPVGGPTMGVASLNLDISRTKADRLIICRFRT